MAIAGGRHMGDARIGQRVLQAQSGATLPGRLTSQRSSFEPAALVGVAGSFRRKGAGGCELRARIENAGDNHRADPIAFG